MSDIQLAVKPTSTHTIHNFGSGNFGCRSVATYYDITGFIYVIILK